MGTVSKKDGRWKAEARVMVKGKSLGASQRFDSKVTADQWVKSKEAELRARLEGAGFPRTTVKELLRRWADEVAPTRGGEKWDVNRLLKIERHLNDLGLDDFDLQDFRPQHMAQLRKERLKTTSPQSVKREESLLKTVWAAARHPDWSLTDVDPFLNLGGIKGSSGRPRTRKAELYELRRILRHLGYHPRLPEATKQAETGLAMMIALRTTLRSQEVLQLSDESVDLDRLIITIGKHKTRHKTNEAKRVVLLPKAYLLLRRKCLGRGEYFTVSPGSRDTLFRKAKQAVGATDLTFHDLKRTAVLSLKRILTQDELMAVTGNRDEGTLQRHYMTDTVAEMSTKVWKAVGVARPVSAGASAS